MEDTRALDGFPCCALKGRKVLVQEERRSEGSCCREGTGPSMLLSLSEHPCPRCILPCPQLHSCSHLGPAVPVLGGLLWAGLPLLHLLSAGGLTLTGALPRAPTAWGGLSRGHRKSSCGWPRSRTSEDKMHTSCLLERSIWQLCWCPASPQMLSSSTLAERDWVDASDPQRGPLSPHH